MTGIVERVRNAISPTRHIHHTTASGAETARNSVSTSADVAEDRGRSAHQQAYTTGRGGAGNIKSGVPADPNELSNEEDRVAQEQRSRRVLSPRSHGRGGAGNIRSPSRDPAERAQQEEQLRKLDEEDRRIEEAYDERTKHSAHSTGRGGAGNIYSSHNGL
ncbi:hypothetical protein CROQUDRAFT_662365 [Cronartium quercuum f. sp. fusiforme G11]|uniref:Uncharacterized protein n=1 Tax=Cronartium quercuum f. sp. fusiforme G11 TaxID=708437 RepID=A0A9P6NE48_9BASI|nr:hypothetical protein CROQUDRAFT_662365 [Cronartium quercuum f. sp. fusiforme G11]